MEQLNRIELRGNVGNVRISEAGGNQVLNMTVATNYVYRGKDGEAVVETTWHNVVVWNGKGMPDFSTISKGMPVYVCGRMRASKYTATDGSEKYFYEVVASKVQIGG